jgi:DnaJ-domain-containing protein 1
VRNSTSAQPLWKIAPEELRKNYLNLQRIVHPDKAQPEITRAQTTAISTELNKGYGILKNELSRAKYLV